MKTKMRNRMMLGIFVALGLGVSVGWTQDATSPGKKENLSIPVARRPVAWLQKGIMYQINMRAFTPEGTLKAAEKRLPDVADLGVTILYLCPVFCADDDPDRTYWSPRQKASGMNNPKNPYRMKDYYHVDPEYGTDDDLKSFVRTAHSLGMKVMLDLVYLHCGPKAVFLEEHPHFVKRDAQGRIVNADWAFPALNYDSPELREYLWANMEYFLREFNVDGYRMDVADGIPLDFWEEGRRRMERIRPDVGALAEGTRPENLRFAFDENYAFRLQPIFPKVLEGREPAQLFREVHEAMARTCSGAQFMYCVVNHDIANESGTRRLEERFTEKGMAAALSLLFALDGTPMLYCGQEICDRHRHSIFGNANECFIHWDESASDAARRRKAWIQRLTKMRREWPEMTEGRLVWLENTTPKSVVSLERILGDTRTLVVISFAPQPVETTVTRSDGTTVSRSLSPWETWIQRNEP